MISVNILGSCLPILLMALLTVDAKIPLVTELSVDACEGSTLNIRCNTGRINIIRANYGRQTKNVCNSNGQTPIRTVNCVSGNSLSIVKAECSNKRECSVQATNGVFGDPCEGTYKYLRVGYQCIGNIQLTKREVACERANVDITCERGEEIKVVRANYGRSSNRICNQNGNAPILTTNCASSNSNRIVNEKCSGKRQCSVSASNNVFGDPCEGTFKYLEVDYLCVKR